MFRHTISIATLCKANKAVAVSLMLGALAGIALADGGGNVMPPNAEPHDYSLDDMASKLALFDTSGNDMSYYPKTPFQILFQDLSKATFGDVTCPGGGLGSGSTGANGFVVSSGTPFFVPVFFVDDSPPVIPVFPIQHSFAGHYFFDPQEVGGKDIVVIVDGHATKLGPDYVAGPVKSPKPLLDGGGSHFIQVGVFLTAMSVGIHTVTIRGMVGGAGILTTFGIHCVTEDYTYLVKVVPGKNGEPEDQEH